MLWLFQGLRIDIGDIRNRLGRAGSRDKFFGYAHGAYKDLGDVKESDIRMAARRGVIKEGIKMAQLGLLAGANDLGGTMYEESISKGAGAQNTDYLDPKEMERVAEDIGRPLCRRTTLYKKA